MQEAGTLVTIAAIISGFGVAMLFFRIQRELHVQENREINWIPWADRLMILATLISLIFVILPLVSLTSKSFLTEKLPYAACAVSIIMVSGYIFSILAHYRLFFGTKREGGRKNPEPAEAYIVYITIFLSIVIFIMVYITH